MNIEQVEIMNEQQILDTCLLALRDATGFKPVFQYYVTKVMDGELDGELSLVTPDDLYLPSFNVEIKNTLRLYHIPHLKDMAARFIPFLVMTDRVHPSVRDELRKSKINYLDTAGNLFLRHNNTVVLANGNRGAGLKKENKNKAFTKTGLKLLFHLLLQPDAINYTYRILAQTADVALGTVKSTIDSLRENDYLLQLNKEKCRLINKKELLDKWITAYGENLKPSLYLGTYHFNDENNFQLWKQLAFDIQYHRWGGEPAADLLTGYLQPQSLLVYTEKKMDLLTTWKLLPESGQSEETGLIRIYKKFWKDSLTDMATNLAPVLLVYADLVLTNDPRCMETAHKIYDQYLSRVIE
jgi:hypothetical protein